jgi:hypothetical protein
MYSLSLNIGSELDKALPTLLLAVKGGRPPLRMMSSHFTTRSGQLKISGGQLEETYSTLISAIVIVSDAGPAEDNVRNTVERSWAEKEKLETQMLISFAEKAPVPKGSVVGCGAVVNAIRDAVALLLGGV